MKFEVIIDDIKKLVGIKIRSIRPGADITLIEVDVPGDRLELLDASNNRRSRPLAELRRVWEQLCLHKAVHVDSVLGGSGSSRNQPETILANLTYVEWLILNGKKHLSFVGKPTHPLGELKRMDPLAVHELHAADNITGPSVPSAVVITDNSRPISNCIEGISGLGLSALAPGVYRHAIADREILIINASTLQQPLTTGVYLTIPAKVIPAESHSVIIAGINYHLVVRCGVNLLIHTI